jgi:FAD binding domain/Berberine and berberine like
MVDQESCKCVAVEAPEMTAEIQTHLKPTKVQPLDAAALAELQRCIQGRLITPGHPSYEEHRKVWNGSIDRYPALVARCMSVADVLAALSFARRTAMRVAVRGGGHSFAGLGVCDGGIVIDLGSMKRIHLDPEKRTVKAQPGVLLGELDQATQAFGFAVPVGSVTHTGLAGLTLGGGIGWLMRKYGLTVDQLLSVELVTADGEVVTASDTENADLFWGVRGGGGNFGIVTSFEFRLNELGPMVFSGLLLWPLDQGPEVVPFYRGWAASAPDELTTALILRQAPAVDPVPEPLRGQQVVVVASCWAGPLERGDTVLEPMRLAGSRLFDLSAPRPYLEHQRMFDPSFPHGIWVYSKATDVPALNDDVIATTLGHADLVESPRSAIAAWQLGGAVARVDELDTPFGSRSSGYLIDVVGATDTAEGFEQQRNWAQDCWAALSPHHSGVYVNWLMEEGEERVKQAYGDVRYRRLKALKSRYDPDNVFQLNQNVSPN